MPAKYLRKAYTSFATHIYDIPPRMVAFLSLIILALLPLTDLPTATLQTLISLNFIAVLAVSWDFLVRSGQASLGHALFFGVGAYGTALLFKYFEWPPIVTIPLGVLAGVGIALLIGFPCLRVKGPYLAIVTFAFPLVLQGIVKFFPELGKDIGIRNLPRLFPTLTYSQRWFAEYYLSLALMAISAAILYKIAYSKTGITFVSILDDELATKACGINVSKYRVMAFVISGLFASLAGSVAAHTDLFQRRATPTFLSTQYSFIPIIVAVLGGMATIYGPLVGAYIYTFIDSYILKQMFNLDDWTRALIFILIVIILLIKWPRGIGRTIVEKLEDLEEPREIEEIERERARKREEEPKSGE
ncbi:MAG: branched-chain amino acid ABC transporter permease [Candidatus Bathyarchaeia archaeon]